MTRKCPAVMKCPYYPDIGSLQILKKDTDIQVISMNIMKVDNIRLKLLNHVNKLNRRPFGIEPMSVGKP